jgi:putative endonuclease
MPSRFVYPATYMMTNQPLGVLYVGSCNNLPHRAWEHREGLREGFTTRYGCRMLIWYEPHDLMAEAIRLELAIKHWRRDWKIKLVEDMNPDWRDLYPGLA